MKTTELLEIIEKTVNTHKGSFIELKGIRTDGDCVEILLLDSFMDWGYKVKLPFPGKYQDEQEEGLKIGLQSLCLIEQ